MVCNAVQQQEKIIQDVIVKVIKDNLNFSLSIK
jgi:hypothetical protein